MIDAFHLPALPRVPTTTREYGRGAAGIRLRLPRLTPALLREQLADLRKAHRELLSDRPVESIVRAVDTVAARLLDPDDVLRRTAEDALPTVTGLSAPMVRHVLDRMAADWRAPRLRALLAADLGDPGVLDGFRPRDGGRRSRAFGPPLAVHVFAGNVIGVPVTSLVRTLLLKSAALGKTASGEPLLAALFARGLREVDAELGRCLAVAYWAGGSEALEQTALAQADAVVVYGGADTVAAVRARTPPQARFVGYGHRLSFGVVGREALRTGAAREAAAHAALAVATFDQHGCVSPHLFYVETGAEVAPEAWAHLLADEMERLEQTLPRGILAPGEAAAVRQLRGEVEFEQLVGKGVVLHASQPGTAWTVIYDPDPAFAASCLNRVVRVKPVPDLDAVARHARAVAPVLQSVGVAGLGDRVDALADALGRLGASRIAPLPQLAWPPPEWHHDARPPLAELVRWCDVEE